MSSIFLQAVGKIALSSAIDIIGDKIKDKNVGELGSKAIDWLKGKISPKKTHSTTHDGDAPIKTELKNRVATAFTSAVKDKFSSFLGTSASKALKNKLPKKLSILDSLGILSDLKESNIEHIQRKAISYTMRTASLLMVPVNLGSLAVTGVLYAIGLMKKPVSLLGAMETKQPKFSVGFGDQKETTEQLKKTNEMIDIADLSIGAFDNRSPVVSGHVNLGQMLLGEGKTPLLESKVMTEVEGKTRRDPKVLLEAAKKEKFLKENNITDINDVTKAGLSDAQLRATASDSRKKTELVKQQNLMRNLRDGSFLNSITDPKEKEKYTELHKKFMGLINEKGYFEDDFSGLRAALFFSPDSGKVNLIFEGSAIEPDQLQRIATTWGSNLYQDVGFLPEIYRQSAQLTDLIQKAIGDDVKPKEDKILRVGGHSLAGGLAQYASVANRVHGYAFNPAAIHYRNQVRIGKGRAKIAEDYLTIVTVRSEMLSKVVQKRRRRINMSKFMIGAKELKLNPHHKEGLKHTVARHNMVPVKESLVYLRDTRLSNNSLDANFNPGSPGHDLLKAWHNEESPQLLNSLLGTQPNPLLEKSNVDGKTPILWLLQQDEAKAVDYFLSKLDKNAILQQKDNNGRNLLHYAAQNGRRSMVKMILKYAPELARDVDNNGKTPLQSIKDIDSPKVKELLESAV